MIPVDQQFLHDPDNGVLGDCFRACIASILELPIEAVPHFVLLGTRWWRATDLFMESLSRDIEWTYDEPPAGHWAIASVDSPRGKDVKHAVVWRDGQIVHDPHPSRAGGKGPNGWFIITPNDPFSVTKLETTKPPVVERTST